MRFLCENCGTQYDLPENEAGRDFVCENCRHVGLVLPSEAGRGETGSSDTGESRIVRRFF